MGRQRLVVGEHQRRPLGPLDHIRYRKCLAAARYTEQYLILDPGIEVFDQAPDRLGLIALWGIFRNETKLHYSIIDQVMQFRKAEMIGFGFLGGYGLCLFDDRGRSFSDIGRQHVSADQFGKPDGGPFITDDLDDMEQGVFNAFV